MNRKPGELPVVGDTVHYFKRVTPNTGPAINGELQTHAALVIRIRAGEDGIDLKITDWDGSTYVVRRIMQRAPDKEPEGFWNWRRP